MKTWKTCLACVLLLLMAGIPAAAQADEEPLDEDAFDIDALPTDEAAPDGGVPVGDDVTPAGPDAEAPADVSAPEPPSDRGSAAADRLEQRRRKALEWAVRKASLIVEGLPVQFMPQSPQAEVNVTSSIKGTVGQDDALIVVDFEKAPMGIWPEAGTKTILCLAKADGDRYQLAGFRESVLPADKGTLDMIRAAMAAEEPPAPVETVETALPAGPAEPETPPELRTLAAQVDQCETVLFGSLTNVQAGEGGEGALGTLKVEASLMGFGDYKMPLLVHFPSAAGALPQAGRYVLFLNGRTDGGGFDVVSPEWGAVRVETDEDRTRLVAGVRIVSRDRVDKLTTIQGTVSAWQDAFNSRDLERYIRCYASESERRKAYDAGTDERRRMREDIEAYPSTVDLTIQAVRMSVPEAGGKRGADVAVLLRLTGEVEDELDATMKFVYEDGQWLILDDGFGA